MDNRQGFTSHFIVLYHAHHARNLEDLPFWHQLVMRKPGPILELGCGTGRVALPLAQDGHTVFALDRDLGMLLFLKERLRVLPELKLHLFQADMSAFHLAHDFQSILLPCNTLSTLSLAERQATFACISRHLTHAGIFAASIPNPLLLKRLPASSPVEVEEIFAHPQDGEPVQVSTAWKRSRQVFTVTWHYDHLLPDGRVERSSIVVQHRLDRLEVYQEQLAAVGLVVIEQYGDFDCSSYTEESPCLILLAMKR